MSSFISRRDMMLIACLTGVAASVAPSQAALLSFKVGLTGAQQVPSVKTAATGTAFFEIPLLRHIQRKKTLAMQRRRKAAPGEARSCQAHLCGFGLARVCRSHIVNAASDRGVAHGSMTAPILRAQRDIDPVSRSASSAQLSF